MAGIVTWRLSIGMKYRCTNRGEVGQRFRCASGATFRVSRVCGGVSFLPRFWASSACLFGLASGCFAPDLDGACRVACDLGCPEEWSCKNDYCVPPHFTGSCATGGAEASSSGGASAGTSGDTNGNPGGDSSGDSSGGAPMDGGAAGTPGGGNGGACSGLEVRPLENGNWCSGDTSLQLQVSGGKAPYTWHANSTCGLSLEPDAKESAVLHGTGTTAGDCNITVTVDDSQGACGNLKRTITVHEIPALDQTQLPAACAFEEYAVQLVARGGDVATRKFETSTSGWSIADNQLRRWLGDPTAKDPIRVSVTVRDDYCTAQPVDLELPIEDPASQRCPKLVIVPPPLADAPANSLPRPCANMPYEIRIEASPEPLGWEPVALPTGLAAGASPTDPSQLAVNGTAAWPAAAAAAMQFRINALDGRHFLYSYSLTPRDKCWFADVERAAERWQLQLWDPELDPALAHRHAFGAADAEVTSMSFSPDGKFLVYQASRASNSELTLVSLSNLQEQAISFTGNVEQYVWSPDASLLAVVTRDTGTTLGGIDVSGVAASSQSDTGIQGLTYLQPVATPIEAPPVWFGDHSLVLQAHSSKYPKYFDTRFAHVELGGFAEVTEAGVRTYNLALTLLGFPGGYVASDGSFLDFFEVGAGNKYTVYWHDDNMFTAFPPSGQFAGHTDQGQLSWFSVPALESTDSLIAQSAAGECGALLAWSDQGERSACVTGSGVGALRFFERGSANPGTLSSTTSTTTYVYSEQSSSERRRVFAKDGRHFAFTTDASLYVVDAKDPRAFYEYSAPWIDGGAERAKQANAIDLAFSADARFVAEHRGRQLKVADLSSNPNSPWVPEVGMNLAPDCSESYIAAPKAWCGAQSAPRDLRWSPRGPWFAFVNESEVLSISYLSTGLNKLHSDQVNAACSGDCVRSFDFQP